MIMQQAIDALYSAVPQFPLCTSLIYRAEDIAQIVVPLHFYHYSSDMKWTKENCDGV